LVEFTRARRSRQRERERERERKIEKFIDNQEQGSAVCTTRESVRARARDRERDAQREGERGREERSRPCAVGREERLSVGSGSRFLVKPLERERERERERFY
jgi:hypothetical protein